MKYLWRGLGTVAVIALVVGVGWFWWNRPKAKESHPEQGFDGTTARIIKFVHPKLRENATLTARQLCVLEPYYKAELNSRLPGMVKSVAVDIGDRVKEGTILVELDVPDVEADVALKKEQLELKKVEFSAALANGKRVEAGLETAKSKINQADASVKMAEALKDFRKKRMDRYATMAREDSVSGDLVDEQVKEFQGAVANLDLAQANLSQARGQLIEKNAEILANQAEIEQKKGAIKVAEKELLRAQTQRDLGKIKAPFDGVVTHRRVGPGDFVSPPSGVSRDPMLTLISDQKMVLSAKFPDSIIVGLANTTRMEATFDQIPGLVISGTISRFSPIISPTDRSVLVEVDLVRGPIPAGNKDPVISVPQVYSPKLIAGLTGTMKLTLESLGAAATIPSGAVFSRQGKPHLFLVEGDRVRLMSATIQIDDGRTAVVQVAPLGEKQSPPRYLSAMDKVVLNRQSELVDGEKVDPREEKP